MPYLSSRCFNAPLLARDDRRLVEGEGLSSKGALLLQAHDHARVSKTRHQHQIALHQHSGHSRSAVLHRCVSKLIELPDGSREMGREVKDFASKTIAPHHATPHRITANRILLRGRGMCRLWGSRAAGRMPGKRL